jgi:hypothetical protein
LWLTKDKHLASHEAALMPDCRRRHDLAEPRLTDGVLQM